MAQRSKMLRWQSLIASSNTEPALWWSVRRLQTPLLRFTIRARATTPRTYGQ
jgi:hypothetical protein